MIVMLIATTGPDPTGYAAAAGLISIGVLIFTVLLIIAPLAIWHHVAKRRAEANAQHNQTIAMLKSINDTLSDIFDAIESNK